MTTHIVVYTKHVYMQHWQELARLNFSKVMTPTMILPMTRQLQSIYASFKIMTHGKSDNTCTVVNDSAMQDNEQINNNDDEIPHGKAPTCVHLDATYTMKYHKCCGRQRWQALQSENG